MLLLIGGLIEFDPPSIFNLMDLSQITILIPTIGRESIFKLITTIPTECNIIVGYDRPLQSHYDTRLIKLLRVRTGGYFIRKVYTDTSNGPGNAKRSLISQCKTPWFMIMDDDDYYHPCFWEFIENFEPEDSVNWISTHYISEDAEYPKVSLELESEYISTEKFQRRYWKWKTGRDFRNQTTEDILKTVYPCSEVLCRLSSFKESMETAPIDVTFNYKVADDALPMTYFMSTTPGELHLRYGLIYTNPTVRVSKIDDPSDNEDLDDILKKMKQLYFKTGKGIWPIAISNLIQALYFKFKSK